MDKDLKQRLKDPREWDALADELGQDRIVRAFLGTTQAVDLISGGVKVNAIPEQARATVNFRIDFTSSVAETFDRVVGILRPVVEGLNLTMAVPGQTTDASVDVVRLSNGHGGNFGLEPAPLTPTKGRAFELIAGTTRHVFPDSIVAPSAMIGAQAPFLLSLRGTFALADRARSCTFSTSQPTPVRPLSPHQSHVCHR